MKTIHRKMKSYHQRRRKLIVMIKNNVGQKIITESINWLPFFDIMEFTADRIKNDKNILPSLLIFFLQCLTFNVGGIKKEHMI